MAGAGTELETGTPKGLERIIRRRGGGSLNAGSSRPRSGAGAGALEPEPRSARTAGGRRRSAEVVARDPATRPKYPSRQVEAPRILAAWEDEGEASHSTRVVAPRTPEEALEQGAELAEGQTATPKPQSLSRVDFG